MLFLLEWELSIRDNSCNKTVQLLNSNPSIVDCTDKNVSQCLNTGRHLQLTTSPFECARACQGLSSIFMFGTNESDVNRCNGQGCICSCGPNIIAGGECDKTRRHDFETYRYAKEQIGITF